MRTIDEWLTLYGRDHQNPANKLIHWFCVPVIMFTVLGLCWCIPFRIAGYEWLNAGTLACLLVLIFYLRLSVPLFLGFLPVGGLMLFLNSVLYNAFGPVTYLYILVSVFVLAWIFQFIGHKMEGQKPSFFEDLQFLLIGPAWILHFLFKKMGVKYN